MEKDKKKYSRSVAERIEPRLEKMERESLVTNVRARPHGERVVESLISGQMLSAERIGYDYRNDEKLPEDFDFQNMRDKDITEKMEYLKAFNQRRLEFARTLNKPEEVNNGVSETPEEGKEEVEVKNLDKGQESS